MGSPLGPPKPAVITQNRLCHRGLFNREVKSLDVRRLLTPGPGGDCPPPAPQTEEGVVGGVPAEALKELAASLASLLGSFGVFSGRELASERRRSLAAALWRHRRGPPDLGVFLAHRTPAQAPGTAPAPRGRRGHRRHPPPQIRCGVSSRSGDPLARGEAGTPRTSSQFRGLGGGGSPCRDPQPTSCCPYGECPKKCPESTLKVPPKYYKSTLKLSPKYPKSGPFTLNCLLSPHSRCRPLVPPAPFLEPPESGR